MRIENASILKVNGLEQCAAKSLRDGAADLVFQSLRIHDCAAIKGFDYPNDFDLSVINGDFRAGSDVATLLDAACEAKSPTRRTLFITPPKPLSGSLKHRTQPLILEVLQTKLQRIYLQLDRKFVHVRLASKVVRSRGQRPIRTLAQRRIGRMKCDPLIRDFIGSVHRGRPGIVVVVFPE